MKVYIRHVDTDSPGWPLVELSPMDVEEFAERFGKSFYIQTGTISVSSEDVKYYSLQYVFDENELHAEIVFEEK